MAPHEPSNHADEQPADQDASEQCKHATPRATAVPASVDEGSGCGGIGLARTLRQ